MMSDEQFSKLPRFARFELERLRADCRYFKEKLGAVDSGDSNTFADISIDAKTALPPFTAIQFNVGKNQNNLTAKLLDDDTLEVRSYDGTIVIEPRACNTIRLKIQK